MSPKGFRKYGRQVAQADEVGFDTSTAKGKMARP